MLCQTPGAAVGAGKAIHSNIQTHRRTLASVCTTHSAAESRTCQSKATYHKLVRPDSSPMPTANIMKGHAVPNAECCNRGNQSHIQQQTDTPSALASNSCQYNAQHAANNLVTSRCKSTHHKLLRPDSSPMPPARIMNGHAVPEYRCCSCGSQSHTQQYPDTPSAPASNSCQYNTPHAAQTCNLPMQIHSPQASEAWQQSHVSRQNHERPRCAKCQLLQLRQALFLRYQLNSKTIHINTVQAVKQQNALPDSLT
jgi:hypothetical protein